MLAYNIIKMSEDLYLDTVSPVTEVQSGGGIMELFGGGEDGYYKRKYMKYKTKYLNLINDNFLPTKFQKAYKNFLYNTSHNFDLSIPKIKYVQRGGGSKFHTWIHNNKKHTFEIKTTYDDNMAQLALISKNGNQCIIVLIYKNDKKRAILESLSSDDDCVDQDITNKVGDTLIRFIIDYLKKYKHGYNINKIVVADNSFKLCDCYYTIKLAQLRMITHGETWYMKYDFKPYHQKGNEEDEYIYYTIQHEKELLKELKTDIVNMQNIFKKIKSKNKIKFDEKEMVRLTNKYTRMRDFIIRLGTEYDKYCCLISYILLEMYVPQSQDQPKLIDLHKKLFYLNI